MPHISKHKLPDDEKDKLYTHLVNTISQAEMEKITRPFLAQLLTETEQIMLGKRLAILFFLHKQVSYYRIQELLHVSPSTVARLDKKRKEEKYSHITDLFGVTDYEHSFIEVLERILQAGMPNQGKDRWEWLDDHFE